MVISKQDKSPSLTVRPEGQPNSPGPKGIPPQVKILQMMNAYRLSQSISVAAKLGIADLLANGLKWGREPVRGGGHADIYKGVLNGSDVAVKKLRHFVLKGNARRARTLLT